MNPAVILALIGDLYAQVNALAEENKQLRDHLTRRASEPGAAPGEPEPPHP